MALPFRRTSLDQRPGGPSPKLASMTGEAQAPYNKTCLSTVMEITRLHFPQQRPDTLNNKNA